jgi:hypothetical protein
MVFSYILSMKQRFRVKEDIPLGTSLLPNPQITNRWAVISHGQASFVYGGVVQDETKDGLADRIGTEGTPLVKVGDGRTFLAHHLVDSDNNPIIEPVPEPVKSVVDKEPVIVV